jgi:hypothetical protein
MQLGTAFPIHLVVPTDLSVTAQPLHGGIPHADSVGRGRLAEWGITQEERTGDFSLQPELSDRSHARKVKEPPCPRHIFPETRKIDRFAP